MVQLVLTATTIIGFMLFMIGAQQKFRFVPFMLGLIICSTSIYLLGRYAYEQKKKEKTVIVNIDELIEKNGVLYLGKEPIFFEQEQIPPILLIRCKSKLVLRYRYNQYFMDVNDNI